MVTGLMHLHICCVPAAYKINTPHEHVYSYHFDHVYYLETEVLKRGRIILLLLLLIILL